MYNRYLRMLSTALSILFAINVQSQSIANLDAAEVPMINDQLGAYIRVEVSGKPLWFVLDSGSYTSFIDPQAAKYLPGVHEFKMRDDHGHISLVSRMPTTGIGNVRLRNQLFTETVWGIMGDVVPGTQERVRGIIGYNILRMLAIGIDFQTDQLWAFPLGCDDNQRRAFFGQQRSFQLLAKMTTEARSIPSITCRLGGRSYTANVDTGATIAGIPAWIVKGLGSQITCKGSDRFIGAEGSTKQRLGVLKSMRIGPQTLTQQPIYVCSDSSDELPLVGWLTFTPMKRVLFDFCNGSIYISKKNEKEAKADEVLSLFKSSVTKDYIITSDQKKIHLDQIRSFFKLSVDGKYDLVNSQFWESTKVAQAVWKGISQEQYGKVTYRAANGERVATLWSGVKLRNWPKPSLNEKIEVQFEKPGYYLTQSGNTVELSSGEIWLPQGFGSPVSIGGLKPVRELPPSNVYRRISIPPRIEYEFLESMKEDSGMPMAVSRTGQISRPEVSAQYWKVPTDSAISLGSWHPIVHTDMSVTLLRQSPKSPNNKFSPCLGDARILRLSSK